MKVGDKVGCSEGFVGIITEIEDYIGPEKLIISVSSTGKVHIARTSFWSVLEESPYEVTYNKSPKILSHTCTLKQYIGFTDSFNYCQECGKKEITCL